MNYLVKWSSNWADEMDIEGFKVMSEDKWIALAEKLKAYKKEFIISVGTNEEINYNNGKKLLNELEAIRLSDEYYKTLKELDILAWGHTNFEYTDYMEEENEDE